MRNSTPTAIIPLRLVLCGTVCHRGSPALECCAASKRTRGRIRRLDCLQNAFVLQCSARAAPTISAMEDGEGFYYFQVGDAIDGRRDDLIAMDGKLVEDNED